MPQSKLIDRKFVIPLEIIPSIIIVLITTFTSIFLLQLFLFLLLSLLSLLSIIFCTDKFHYIQKKSIPIELSNYPPFFEVEAVDSVDGRIL